MKTRVASKIDRSTVGVRLGVCAAALGGAAAAPEAQAQIVSFNTPVPVPQTFAGVYLNLGNGTTGGSSSLPGWDFNPYANGTTLNFYWSAPGSGVAGTTTGPYLDLPPGTVIGPGSTYTAATAGTTGSPYLTPGTHTLGFQFANEANGLTNYGYATLVSTTADGSGFPLTITGWSYEASGGPITVAGVPEPSSMLLTAAAMVAGSRGLRRWRRQKVA